MLVSRNRLDKKQSVYSCDRCKAQLSVDTKVAIYIGLPSRQPKKKYEYCFRCYKALERGTERGINKNN